MPEVKWLMAWKRVKQTLICRDREKKNRNTPLKELQRDLLLLRKRIQTQDNEILSEELTRKEAECLKKEKIESELQKRSRLRWMASGDAPSRYFYAQLPARQVRDSIKCLELEGGHRITDEREIKQEVQDYYTKLYEADIQPNQLIKK
ncbi:hypothetical protein R1sor_001785 [Riccia sorocarpa]|uniref:Uncharacterized protein n=1 Tax=Riccia sorocarpa TaxID=122646 RepID=A0ABD3GWX1_9MARC